MRDRYKGLLFDSARGGRWESTLSSQRVGGTVSQTAGARYFDETESEAFQAGKTHSHSACVPHIISLSHLFSKEVSASQRVKPITVKDRSAPQPTSGFATAVRFAGISSEAASIYSALPLGDGRLVKLYSV
jgi:hypothetical protein